MKALFLALMLSIGAFAGESYTYWDQELDLSVEIPVELKRTWNLYNSQTGFALNVFNTNGEDENLYVMAIGKVPLNVGEGEAIDLLPAILEEFYKDFSCQECNYLSEEVDCYVERLPPFVSNVDFSNHYRVHLCLDEELEDVLHLDIHLFSVGGHSCFVVTGGLDCSSPDDLDDFSEKILQNMRIDDV
jgi:hypothetical protein